MAEICGLSENSSQHRARIIRDFAALEMSEATGKAGPPINLGE